ncbi:MAG: DnaJ domain-containing protein [Chloroflexaceae bacterium]|nr:DnaJ domain-containing protein [Chloroflexaceae bacterium]
MPIAIAMEDFELLDYYELLGVAQNASTNEIKTAYRKQISRYHPDRYAVASPDEQRYASRRTQRINEAYRTLNNFNLRVAYHRIRESGPSHAPSKGRARATGGDDATQRDRQAELYDQARAHLQAGRYGQAVAVLHELQAINPFYRDSAVLLARARAASQGPTPHEPAGPASEPTSSSARTAPKPEPQGISSGWFRRLLPMLSSIGAVAIVAVVVAMVLLPKVQTGSARDDQGQASATPQSVAGAGGQTTAEVAPTKAPPVGPTRTPIPSPAPTNRPPSSPSLTSLIGETLVSSPTPQPILPTLTSPPPPTVSPSPTLPVPATIPHPPPSTIPPPPQSLPSPSPPLPRPSPRPLPPQPPPRCSNRAPWCRPTTSAATRDGPVSRGLVGAWESKRDAITSPPPQAPGISGAIAPGPGERISAWKLTCRYREEKRGWSATSLMAATTWRSL